MSVKDRLKAFCESKKINIAEFERLSGLSNGYVNSISVSIGNRGLEKISTAFPELNMVWLKMGEGSMLKNNTYKTTEDTQLHTAQEPEEKYLRLIPVDAMAGEANGDTQIMEYETQKFLVPTFRDADFLIPVRGNSMWPKYNSGDLVACKRLSDYNFFQWNKVYVLDTCQGALVKRIKKSSIEGHILCVSENPSYEPFDLNIQDIRALAIVIGVIRLE